MKKIYIYLVFLILSTDIAFLLPIPSTILESSEALNIIYLAFRCFSLQISIIILLFLKLRKDKQNNI